jgi:hypothetical protein
VGQPPHQVYTGEELEMKYIVSEKNEDKGYGMRSTLKLEGQKTAGRDIPKKPIQDKDGIEAVHRTSHHSIFQ